VAPAPVVLQPGLLQCRPQYTVDPDSGDHPENVLWFLSGSTSAPTLANLSAIAAVFDPAWANMWKTVGASNKNYTGSVWTDFSTVFGLSTSSVGTFTVVPGLHGGCFPSNVSVLISMHILERWRGGHPRTYLPWISTGCQWASDADQVDPTILATCISAFSAINTATIGSGVLGGQSQRIYREKSNPATAHLMPINSFNISNRFATQRRRLRKAPHH
jgi:hypothetical protein